MGLPSLLFHLAETPNQRSIERLGLLSASDLIEHADLPPAWHEKHRPHRLTLPTGVVLRDQKPMLPAALKRCLREMTPEEWYRLLNSKIFLWIDLERLNHRSYQLQSFIMLSYTLKSQCFTFTKVTASLLCRDFVEYACYCSIAPRIRSLSSSRTASCPWRSISRSL